MTAKRAIVIQKWIGTDAERLALTTTALPVGSKFFETDTTATYIWSGTAWVAYPTYLASGGAVTAPTGRTASYVFATADALSSDKAQANQVLTGTADNVYVSAALTAGYKVIVFLGVTATFANTVTLLANGTIIQANGVNFNNNASTPLFADGGKTGCVFRDISTDAGGLTVNLANTTLQNVTLGSYFVGLSVPNSLSNTIFGQAALQNNTTGNYNSAFGQNALLNNTTGLYNNAFGQAALYSNTTGYQNNAFGQSALQNNTTGLYNNAFGQGALYSNTTGYQNNAFGQAALQLNTTGQQNNAFGAGALYSNTTGNYNNAFGQGTLQNNTTGQQNNAFGAGALQLNTTGYQNSAFGQAALNYNTTGNNNLGLGYYAGLYNTTISNQLFINTFDQGSYANDVSKSLIYGIFNATPASQTLSLNAGIINMKYIPSADPHVLGQIYQVLATHVLMVSNG